MFREFVFNSKVNFVGVKLEKKICSLFLTTLEFLFICPSFCPIYINGSVEYFFQMLFLFATTPLKLFLLNHCLLIYS